MKIISIENVTEKVYQNKSYMNHTVFSQEEDDTFIYEVSKGDISVVKSWMDRLCIKYDTLYFIHNKVAFTIKGVTLSPQDLGSGERILLYLLACKLANKEIIIGSVLERLGGTYEQFLYDEFKDDNFLTIIKYNAIIPREYKYLIVNDI